uniref:Pentatricopeptide repeat-containing protein n=1 Tax=Plectus sambesii TaxID=2011161 RepID=A0A914X687_9BILA
MLRSVWLLHHAARIRKSRSRILAACSCVQSTSKENSNNWICSRSINHDTKNGGKSLKTSYATSLFDTDDADKRRRAGRKDVDVDKRLVDKSELQAEQSDYSNRTGRQDERYHPTSSREEELQLQSVGLSLDQQIAYFETLVAKSGRIKADVFDERIVEKIVRGNADYVSYLRQNPVAVVVLISWCGEVLSSVTVETRLKILDRLWNAFKDNGLMTTSVFNARLSVWLENDVPFEPKAALKEIRSMSLSPDIMTYKYLMAQFCKIGDEQGVLKVLDFMKGGGLEVEDTLNYGLIYLHSLKGDEDKVKALLKTIKSKYNEEGVSIALGAMLRAATSTGDVEKVRAVLKESVERDVLIDDDSVLKSVRNLAKHGDDSQLVEICQKSLERAQVAPGYFSKSVNTMNQLTLASKYFLFVEVLRSISRQFANFFEPVQVVMHHMAAKNTPKDIFINIVDEIERALLLDDSSVLDFGIMACATHEDYTRASDLTWLIVTLCNRLDASRQRPHLFFPLFFNKFKEIASIDQLIDNARAFFEMGYKLDDPAYLQYFALQVVTFAFEKLGTAQATERLREFVPQDTWRQIMNYLNQRNVTIRNKRATKGRHNHSGEDPLLRHLKESAELEQWNSDTVMQSRAPLKKKNTRILFKDDRDSSLSFEPEPSSWDLEEEVPTRSRQQSSPKSKDGKKNRVISDKDRLHQLDVNQPYAPESSSWDSEREEAKKRKGRFKTRAQPRATVDELPFIPEPTSWDIEEEEVRRQRVNNSKIRAQRMADEDIMFMPEPTPEEEQELHRQAITAANEHSSGAAFNNVALRSQSTKKGSSNREGRRDQEIFPGLRRPDNDE